MLDFRFVRLGDLLAAIHVGVQPLEGLGDFRQLLTRLLDGGGILLLRQLAEVESFLVCRELGVDELERSLLRGDDFGGMCRGLREFGLGGFGLGRLAAELGHCPFVLFDADRTVDEGLLEGVDSLADRFDLRAAVAHFLADELHLAACHDRAGGEAGDVHADLIIDTADDHGESKV